MIELRSVSKSFGQVRAVDKISFATREGEIFGLLGPNGAGKSTTIKMIMNILAPDAGSILFNGNAIRGGGQGPHRLPARGARALPQGEDQRDAPLPRQPQERRTAPRRRRRLDEWLERFDLAEWKTRTPEALSKGMAQKVQFIAADPPRSRVPLPRRALLGPRPGEHGRAAGGGAGAGQAGARPSSSPRTTWRSRKRSARGSSSSTMAAR